MPKTFSPSPTFFFIASLRRSNGTIFPPRYAVRNPTFGRLIEYQRESVRLFPYPRCSKIKPTSLTRFGPVARPSQKTITSSPAYGINRYQRAEMRDIQSTNDAHPIKNIG